MDKVITGSYAPISIVKFPLGARWQVSSNQVAVDVNIDSPLSTVTNTETSKEPPSHVLDR